MELPVKIKPKHLLLFLLLIILGLAYLYWEPLSTFLEEHLTTIEIRQRVVSEETAVISVVENASPAVVSVVEEQTINSPFFGTQTGKQGIGTGFIIRANGLILTNRHVVSDTNVTYTVVTKDGKKLDDYQLDVFFGEAVIYQAGLNFDQKIGVIFRDQNIDQSITDLLVADPPKFIGLSSEFEFDASLEKLLLERGIISFENLANTIQLPNTFIFYGIPLNIPGADGSPVRAYALVDEK